MKNYQVLSPIKAIRFKCQECSNFQPSEIRNCVITDCPLYPFRMGKNPNRSGIGNKKGRFGQNLQTQVSKISGNNADLDVG